MKVGFLLKDMEEIWQSPCDEAKAMGSTVAREDNLVMVNNLLVKQGQLMVEMQELVKQE